MIQDWPRQLYCLREEEAMSSDTAVVDMGWREIWVRRCRTSSTISFLLSMERTWSYSSGIDDISEADAHAKFEISDSWKPYVTDWVIARHRRPVANVISFFSICHVSDLNKGDGWDGMDQTIVETMNREFKEVTGAALTFTEERHNFSFLEYRGTNIILTSMSYLMWRSISCGRSSFKKMRNFSWNTRFILFFEIKGKSEKKGPIYVD